MDIRTRIENSTPEQRIELFNDIYVKWTAQERNKPKDIFECVKIILNNFGLNSQNFQMGIFEKNVHSVMANVAYLKLYILSLDNPGDQREILTDKINTILKILVAANNTVRCISVLEKTINNQDPEIRDICSFTPIDMEQTTEYQNLLLFLLETLARKGYRRYNKCCYEKIYTPQGYDTHCWKKTMTLKEFIYSSADKETHFEMWQNLTHSKANADCAEVYLSNHYGVEFEDIKKDRNIFAFQDGIYFCKKLQDSKFVDEFIPYASQKRMYANFVSANYFPHNFDEETRPNPNDKMHRYNNWFNIIIDKCPSLKTIMDYQEWPEEVQKWLCIMLGRLLYDVGELDNWQVLPYFLGQAQSGKSTLIIYVCKRFYEIDDIAILGNNVERGFGLQSIYDKKMFLCPEIKGNFRLEQAEFQSIVSGESVAVNRKHLGALSLDKWTAVGIAAGNELPNFTDNSGSVSRRIFTFIFSKKVKKGDTQLGNKLEKEIPYIIHACNRAYLEAVNTHGSEDIWTIVPEYFRQSREEIMENTNALVGFLKSDRVILGPGEHCREKEFSELFNAYCMTSNIVKPTWSKQYYMGPFSEFNIVVKKHAKYGDVIGTVLTGISVRRDGDSGFGGSKDPGDSFIREPERD